MASPSLLLGPLVGGLAHNCANIWARADAPANLHVWLATKANASDAAWSGSTELPAKDGCAGIVPLVGLKPETSYYYAVSLQKKRPPQTNFHAFTTFPKPGAPRTFSFMFGSCYRPADEHGGQSMDELYRHIESGSLRFGMFLGDQIYADSWEYNGLGRVAVTLDEYRAVYAHNWSRPAMQKILPDLPLFMTLDDHEVDNDWRWHDPSRRWADIPVTDKAIRWLKGRPPQERHLPAERVSAALKAYDEHQSIHAPDIIQPMDTDARGEFLFEQRGPGSLAYNFHYGKAAFFVLDTRTMRVGTGKRSMLGEGQWHLLREWLKESNQKYPVKFIVSSCSLLHPFWMDIAGDRWSGFREERKRLLEFLATNEIEGVRILTGDLHSGHAVTAELKCPSGRRLPIAEFCASPFEQENVWLRFAYIPILSKWLARPKRHFYQAWCNFGIVNVDFDSPEPIVTFTLHYNNDGWKAEPITA
jgi:phosphodiesterase/alkaline phosphatase D-like protein